MYMRDIFMKRNDRGHFKLLIPDLLSDESMFFNYFRMSKQRFNDLLRRVGPAIQRKSTHRLPICAEERLSLTVRILASGDSQVSLLVHIIYMYLVYLYI